MPAARERLDADKLLPAQVDLRLVPELDPAVREHLAQFDAGRPRRGVAELQRLHDRDDRVGVERLLEHRQHLQVMLLADAPHMLHHGGAARAHELHGSAIAAPAEIGDGFDRFRGVQPDVQEHEVGRAPHQRVPETGEVGQFLGFDADAMQHQRQEAADARRFVDDKADRHGRRPVTAGVVSLPGAG